MSDREYTEAFGRIRDALGAGNVIVQIWDLRDKTVMTDTSDNRRVAEEYRVAYMHARRGDGTAGELQEQLTIRRTDVATLVASGATLRGRAAR